MTGRVPPALEIIMARELLAEARITDDMKSPNDAYALAQNVALGEVMERWSKGLSSGPGARVENVQLKDGEGTLIGFRLYLVVGENPRLGPASSEIVDD